MRENPSPVAWVAGAAVVGTVLFVLLRKKKPTTEIASGGGGGGTTTSLDSTTATTTATAAPSYGRTSTMTPTTTTFSVPLSTDVSSCWSINQIQEFRAARGIQVVYLSLLADAGASMDRVYAANACKFYSRTSSGWVEDVWVRGEVESWFKQKMANAIQV